MSMEYNNYTRSFILCFLIIFVFLIINVNKAQSSSIELRKTSTPLVLVPNVTSQTSIVTITGDLTSQTPQEMIQSLVGNGIQISNITSNCDPLAAGTFTTTGYTGIGLSSGIVLSTGYVSDVVGPNNAAGKGTDLGRPGDSDLNKILAAGTGSATSHDACVLEFDFIPTTSTVSFDYVFGSEEYNEFVDSSYNDVFGFFINGVNCAVIDDLPVSINALNDGNPAGSGGPNSDYFINNDTAIYNTQLDGLTQTLTCSAPVNPGIVNHVKLAIADAGDGILDSAVFIGAGSFVSSDYQGKISPTYSSKIVNNLSTATYSLAVKNIGAQTDSFDIAISGNSWPTVFADSKTTVTKVGPLESMETTYVYPQVTVPKDVTGFDTATVTATSVGAGIANTVNSVAYITTQANGSSVCKFIREVPKLYIPNMPIPVSIHLIPTCVFPGTKFDLQESVPSGWAVSAVSDGGIVSSGTITWTSLPGKDAIVSYYVTPPLAASQAVAFSGQGIVSGVSFPVTGKTTSTLNSAHSHPADSGKDNNISLAELSIYSTYWKAGKNWMYGWNPITSGFITKAGEIWVKNQGYAFDATKVSCPDCWVVGGISPSYDVSTAMIRTLQAKYTPGQPVDVMLSVSPPTGTNSYVVEDAPPVGWSVSNINNNGTYDGINKKIKWGVYKDVASVTAKTFSYTATPPINYSGTKQFSAIASFDGVDTNDVTSISTDAQLITVETATPDFMHNGFGPFKITITGSGFATGATVQFSGNGITVSSVNVLDSETLTLLATIDETATPGMRNITVTNPNSVTGTFVGGFEVKYRRPIVVVTFSQKAASTLLDASGESRTIKFLANPKTSISTLKETIQSDSWIVVDLRNLKFVNGRGTLTYTAINNQSSDVKTGHISIGTATYTVFQAGLPCSISAEFSHTIMPAAGGQLWLYVDVTPNTCKWRVASASGDANFFTDKGNFPAISNVPIVGGHTYTAIVGSALKSRQLSVKFETIDKKGKKSLVLKQIH